MKQTHQPKDQHGRSTPLQQLQPPLFTQDRGADGTVPGLRRSSGVNETEARWKLGLRGYRLHSGALFYVVNDDPEDFREALVANWDGTARDAWIALEAHGFPTSPFVLCQACQEGEADFGGLCDPCSREVVEWVRAGEYL